MKYSFNYLSFYITLSLVFLFSVIMSYLSNNINLTVHLSNTYFIIISIILLIISLSNVNFKMCNTLATIGCLFGSALIFITLNLPLCFSHYHNTTSPITLSGYYLFIYTFALFLNFSLLGLTYFSIKTPKIFRTFVWQIVLSSLILSFLLQVFAMPIERWVSGIGTTPFMNISLFSFVTSGVLCFLSAHVAYKYASQYMSCSKSVFLSICLLCHGILLGFGLRIYLPFNILLIVVQLILCFCLLYLLLKYSFIQQYHTLTDKLTIHEKNNILLNTYLETMSKSHQVMNQQYTEIDALYTQMVHFYPDPLFIVRDNSMIQVNTHASTLLSYLDTAGILGKPFTSLIASEDLPHFNETLGALLTETMPQALLDLRMVAQDGTYRDVSMSISLSKPHSAMPNTYIVSLRDLSLQRQKDTLAQQVELEKMKVEFFSTISHELKTPVNIIYSAIQLQNSLQQHNDLEKALVYNTMISQNCLRLLRLLNNLLDINRIESHYFTVTPKLINITYFTESIIESVEPYASKKGLCLTFDTNAEEVYVSLDPDLYERTLLNLLSNAIKYCNEDGSIFVSVISQSDQVSISVKDDGVGIPKDSLETIFTRFTRVENGLTRKAEGAGIGLSLVKSFVELNKGHIWVDSEPEKGSCFSIVFQLNPIQSHLEAFDTSIPSIEKVNIELSDIFL